MSVGEKASVGSKRRKLIIDSLKNGRPKSEKPVWILGSKFVVGEEEEERKEEDGEQDGGDISKGIRLPGD